MPHVFMWCVCSSKLTCIIVAHSFSNCNFFVFSHLICDTFYFI